MAKKRLVCSSTRPNIGIELQYQRAIDAMIDRMQRDVVRIIMSKYKRQPPKMAADELWEKNEDCEPLKLKIDVWDNEVKWVDTETGHYPFPIYTSSDGDLIYNVVMSIIDFINWYNAKK